MGKSDNYTIEDKDKPIGEGSFEKVYRGWKRDTKQLVALKFISKVRGHTRFSYFYQTPDQTPD